MSNSNTTPPPPVSGIATVGLQSAIWSNNLRSFFLLGTYPLILGGLVWLIAAAYGAMMLGNANMTGPTVGHAAAAYGDGVVVQYWPLIAAAVVMWFLISLVFHATMIRALAKSTPVTRQQEPVLYNALENLCIARGLPMPSLQIIETDARNAFSSGIGKRSYSVTVTRGLLDTLLPDELEAVLAHELTHILNNDVRLMMIAIIFVGMLGFAAQLLWSQIRWNLYFRPMNMGGRRDRGGNNWFLFLLIVDIILWFGYLTTLVTRFALSRHREIMADEGAVQLTKNAGALMRALMRIDQHDQIPHAATDISRLCITNSRAPFFGLFLDHPETPARLAHLSAISGEPIPTSLPPVTMLHSGRVNPWQ